MIILKKTVIDDVDELVDPYQLIDECNPKSFELFQLAKCCTDVLNYFVENTPDAFGNAPYARLEGFMRGYIAGKGMEIDEGEHVWDIKKGKRTILRIEVPKLPQSYHSTVKENDEIIRKVLCV